MRRTGARRLARLALAVACAAALGAAAAGCATADAEAPAREDFRAKVRTARVGDGTIAWHERGTGAPLVMAIGTGSTMAEWDPALLRLLARDRRLILFDYPGIGLSSPLRARRTSFADLADRTARFMDAIGVPRADVLGWSMGGFVAQQLAVRHPERVRRLILAGPTPAATRPSSGTRTPRRSTATPPAPTRRRSRSSTRRRRRAGRRAAASSRGWTRPARTARSPTTSRWTRPPCGPRSPPRTPGCARTPTGTRSGRCARRRS